jgi:hypothetical protein
MGISDPGRRRFVRCFRNSDICLSVNDPAKLATYRPDLLHRVDSERVVDRIEREIDGLKSAESLILNAESLLPNDVERTLDAAQLSACQMT